MIELLIVIAIILIIAAIAIPNLLRARIAANESSAAASVRSIATAEVTYNAAYPSLGYAAALANLGGLPAGCTPSSATACLIDPVLSTGVKSGYAFKAAGFPSGAGINVTFVVGSAPSVFNQIGRPQLLHHYGWSSAQQSGRPGRGAGPGCPDLRGLRGRSIDNNFKPGCRRPGRRDHGSRPFTFVMPRIPPAIPARTAIEIYFV